jgi:hypothetical protein
VGKPGGTFLFSSHNLDRVDDQFQIRPTRDPRRLARSLWSYFLMRCRNHSLRALRRMDHAIVNDGSYNRRLSWLIASFRERLGYYYFIRPAAQLSQLAGVGLPGARVYALSGRELVTASDFAEAPDHWLYYLCSL